MSRLYHEFFCFASANKKFINIYKKVIELWKFSMTFFVCYFLCYEIENLSATAIVDKLSKEIKKNQINKITNK